MTDQDRLAEIEEWPAGPQRPRWHVDWLVGEVERLRGEAELFQEAWTVKREEVDRLRGLLRRLEWRGCQDHFECPACGARKALGDHDPDCWLAAALA